MTAPSSDGNELAGKLIGGKYRLIRRLGEGGMGAVFEAEHTGIGTHVAVKVLRPEFAVKTEHVNRFKQEARITARIGHPNIVTILDLDCDPVDKSFYMVQELLSGVDLRKLLDRAKRLSPDVAVSLCLPVLSALAAAHEGGVLHRDLKPANIFLCGGTTLQRNITPKVIDFGIAKVMHGDDETGHTRDGALIGTLSYMSPEQLSSDPTIDARTDVWAMGCVLYEMLAGACPFKAPSGSADNLLAIAEFAAHVNRESAPPISDKIAGLPPRLAEIVTTALARDRKERFPTMRAFHDALAAVAVSIGGQATRTMESTVIGLDLNDVSFIADVATPPAPIYRAPPKSKAPSPWKTYTLAGLMIAAAILALAVGALLRRPASVPKGDLPTDVASPVIAPAPSSAVSDIPSVRPTLAPVESVRTRTSDTPGLRLPPTDSARTKRNKPEHNEASMPARTKEAAPAATKPPASRNAEASPRRGDQAKLGVEEKMGDD